MSLSSAVTNIIRTLRTEETRIQRELEAIRGQIKALGGVASGRAGKRGPGRPKGSTTAKRKMSAKGRAAISRAAKKRWAAWRKAKGDG